MNAQTAAPQLLDSSQFAPLVDDAAAVYGVAMQRSRGVTESRRDLIRTHLQRDGFAAVTLSDVDSPVIGFAYGYLTAPGQWWHDVVAANVGPEIALTWLGEAFELAELHVLPAHQGRGAGRGLINLLITNTGGRTVVLSTHDIDSPARRLYRSLGFVDLLTHFRFPGSSEIFAVMGLRRR